MSKILCVDCVFCSRKMTKKKDSEERFFNGGRCFRHPPVKRGDSWAHPGVEKDNYCGDGELRRDI